MSAESLSATPTTDPDVNASLEVSMPPVSLGDQLRYGPIVVAVSGARAGAGPVRMASALEARYGSRVSAIQVLDASDLPLPAPLPAAVTCGSVTTEVLRDGRCSVLVIPPIQGA